MTLIVGLRGADGVVLASDSQGTHGTLKQSTPKLFRTEYGLIWGTAGQLAGAQTLYAELERLDLEPNPSREAAKAGIREAMHAAAKELIPPKQGDQEWLEGLFGWYGQVDKHHYLLRARHDGHVEFLAPYGAIGSSSSLGAFGFSRSEFLGYKTLPLETTKMLTFMVTEDAVKASAQGVDLPVQMAVVSRGKSAVVNPDELERVRDTVNEFRARQRDLLVRKERPVATPQRGIVPGEKRG